MIQPASTSLENVLFLSNCVMQSACLYDGLRVVSADNSFIQYFANMFYKKG